MSKLLLVDDEIGLLEMLSIALKKEGFYDIDLAINAKEALSFVSKNRYSVIILDVMLPDMDGYHLCTKIREKNNAPILFLTARTTDLDVLTGFNVGGDDYITKPFKPLEVVARIKANIRREERNQQWNVQEEISEYQYGYLTVKIDTAQLFVNEKEIPCTAKEFQLLSFFCQHPNHVFSLNHLYEKVWGVESIGDTNTVMVYMNRLRKKIEKNPKDPKIFINLRGLGYKFIPPKDTQL